jgi:hypothetical protein
MNTITTIKKSTKLKIKRRKLPKKVVSIRLDPTIHQRADQFANEDKRSFSQYVELVLEQHIKERERKEQQTIKEQQELAKYFQPGATYPVFTPYDTGNAAAQLQTFLEQHRT